MANYHNQVWNEWPDVNSGRQILLSGSPDIAHSQLLYTVVNDPDYFDDIWIWGTGLDGVQTLVGIGFGGLAAGDLTYANIPARGSGPWAILPGWSLGGGLPIYGFGDRSASCTLKIQVRRTRKVTTA